LAFCKEILKYYNKVKTMAMLSSCIGRSSALGGKLVRVFGNANHVSSHNNVTSRRWMMAAASVSSQQETQDLITSKTVGAAAAAAFVALGLVVSSTTTSNKTVCEANEQTTNKEKQDDHHWTPAEVAKEDFGNVVEAHDIDKFPVYTSDQVAVNDGQDGKPIWMSYGGVVYDVTNFIPNHPGGSEKILMAAGTVCRRFDCEKATGCFLSDCSFFVFMLPFIIRRLLNRSGTFTVNTLLPICLLVSWNT
jgi:predicted heme/steroid binding protein